MSQVNSISFPKAHQVYLLSAQLLFFAAFKQPLTLGCRIFLASNFPHNNRLFIIFFLVIGVSRNSLEVREGGLENVRKVHRTSSTILCATPDRCSPTPRTCVPDYRAEHELHFSSQLITLAKHPCAVNNLYNPCRGPREEGMKWQER